LTCFRQNRWYSQCRLPGSCPSGWECNAVPQQSRGEACGCDGYENGALATDGVICKSHLPNLKLERLCSPPDTKTMQCSALTSKACGQKLRISLLVKATKKVLKAGGLTLAVGKALKLKAKQLLMEWFCPASVCIPECPTTKTMKILRGCFENVFDTPSPPAVVPVTSGAYDTLVWQKGDSNTSAICGATAGKCNNENEQCWECGNINGGNGGRCTSVVGYYCAVQCAPRQVGDCAACKTWGLTDRGNLQQVATSWCDSNCYDGAGQLAAACNADSGVHQTCVCEAYTSRAALALADDEEHVVEMAFDPTSVSADQEGSYMGTFAQTVQGLVDGQATSTDNQDLAAFLTPSSKVGVSAVPVTDEDSPFTAKTPSPPTSEDDDSSGTVGIVVAVLGALAIVAGISFVVLKKRSQPKASFGQTVDTLAQLGEVNARGVATPQGGEVASI